ncbi:MAG: UDP-N-acetylglucosamine 2-epimerase (non-hydrolyzing) [Gemmatimonadota bacterium]
MRILTVVGTRPEIIRLSVLIPKLDAHFDHVLVHTGQNHSANLSDIFFRDLKVRQPDRFLGVDTSSFAAQLAGLFTGFEQVLDSYQPDRVLILGDTNSGLLAYNAKRRQIPVFHMEAGNRCFDDRVPEEVNRKVIDHCSRVLMPYTHRSAANLVEEGIARHRIFVTGNPIFEVLNAFEAEIEASDALARHGVEKGEYLLATMHRAENVDDPATFQGLCSALGRVAAMYDRPLILSVHPRIRDRLTASSFPEGEVRSIEAMPFFEFVKLQKNAALVLSDSGTVQEECAIYGIPTVTIRETTERPETVECGSNLIGTTNPDRIVAAARFLRSQGTRADWAPPPEYVVPNVSDIVTKILLGNIP